MEEFAQWFVCRGESEQRLLAAHLQSVTPGFPTGSRRRRTGQNTRHGHSCPGRDENECERVVGIAVGSQRQVDYIISCPCSKGDFDVNEYFQDHHGVIASIEVCGGMPACHCLSPSLRRTSAAKACLSNSSRCSLGFRA